MSSLPKLESTSHADWSRTNFTTQPPRGVWGYAASASPSTPFQTASRYRGQGGVSSTKSHLAPRSSLLSVQKCSAHGIDAALPQPSNWLAWPKRSLKPPNANDSDQPEPTVRGLAPGGRCWPKVRDRHTSAKAVHQCHPATAFGSMSEMALPAISCRLRTTALASTERCHVRQCARENTLKHIEMTARMLQLKKYTLLQSHRDPRLAFLAHL